MSVKNISLKNLSNEIEDKEIINKSKYLLYKIVIENETKINLDLKIISINKENSVNFIFTNKLSYYTFPLNDDRIYSLNKLNHSQTTNFSVKTGTYYLKVIYNSNVNQQISIKYSKIKDPVITSPVSIINKKYALLVSISDYSFISDLSFCDEDIICWMDYLKKFNYECILLGDNTSNYGKYKKDDLSTEDNIKKWMKKISSLVKTGDQFVFITSGHGAGDGKGNSYLCCLDCNGKEQGSYRDIEMAQDIKSFTDKKVSVICFFDICFSGGMLKEICDLNKDLVCATSTCTDNGFGFDVSNLQHGAWTYYFLVKTLLSENCKNLNEIFYKAIKIYPYGQGNTPQILGNGKLMF